MNTPRLFPLLAAALSLTLGAIASPEEDAKNAIVDLEVKDMPAAKVIEFVGKLAKVKTHYAAPAKNDPVVTLVLTSVPATDAFKHIAALANLTLTYQQDGVHFAPVK
jgi:hypothetical protein